MSWPWSVLGLDGPAALPEIRRAYAQKLKTTHPEEDPEGFQRLHDAYQQACRLARQQRRRPIPTPEEPPRPPVSRQRDGARDAKAEASGQAEDWDYDKLLKDGEGQKKRPASSEQAPEEESEDWDYDELLKGEEGKQKRPASSEASPKDWDFERLFAEGEEEAQATRRKKLEELREKNRARIKAQEAEQRRRAGDEEEAWAAVMAAAHALELLLSTGAPLPQWRAFLQSRVFWNVRGNLDFLFAMEDFVEQNPDLPKAVRKAIFSAYGFNTHVRPEQRRLYRLLNVDWKERWKLRWSASQWHRWPARRRFATVFGVLFLGLMAVLAFWDLLGGAGSAMRALFPPKASWQEEMCVRLEEDYHRRFIHPYEDGEYIFAPEDDPDLLFFAYEEEEGYQTNYPERMVMAQMELFAEAWDLPLELDSAGEGYQGQLGETPGAYYLQMPLTGKGEAIQELGELLEAMADEPWYRTQPPDFEIFLAYGNLHFYQFRSTEGDYDADYAQTVYENKFGPELCRYIADHAGAAEADMGADAYVLMERGTIRLGDGMYFWVTGLTKPPDGVPLFQYFLSTDGTRLYSVPNETAEAGFDLDALLQNAQGVKEVLPELGDHQTIEVYHLSA